MQTPQSSAVRIIQFVGYAPSTQHETDRKPYGPAVEIAVRKGSCVTLLSNFSSGVIGTRGGYIHYENTAAGGVTDATVAVVPTENAVSQELFVTRLRFNNPEKTEFTEVATEAANVAFRPATMRTKFAIANLHGLADSKSSPVWLFVDGVPIRPWADLENGAHEGFSKSDVDGGEGASLFVTGGPESGDAEVRLLVVRTKKGEKIYSYKAAMRRIKK